jgi:predicted ATPase
VCFVPLETVADPALVPAAVAHALGLREAGAGPVAERLREYVRARALLLVLDNFEHLLAAAPAVAALLAAGDRLRLLVTSRAALRVSGEQEFPVAPLPVPALPGDSEGSGLGAADLARLEACDAVRLFVERVRAVRPDFRLTPDAGGAVAALCVRLDGLPLALELAAARVRVLSPPAMLAQLRERRLPLLAGGVKDAPERQRTLRGAIAWSYDLLPAGQQRLFRRLAVFAGGCPLEAAAVVCADPGPEAGPGPGAGLDPGGERGAVAPPDVFEVLDGLDGLVASSLLRPEPGAGGGARYRLLETVREFGLERLAALGPGAAGAAFRRHAAYYLDLAEAGDAGLRGAEQGRWLERLEDEHDNLRAALRWLTDQGEAVAALRLAGALWLFWWWRGHLAEARHHLARALALPGAGGAGPAVLARAAALERDAFFAAQQGEAGAAAGAETALALRERAGDRRGSGWTRVILGMLALKRGDAAAAAARYGAALEIHRAAGDRYGTAVAISGLGKAAQAGGDYAAARDWHRESLALRRPLGDRQGVAEILEDLGQLALDTGDLGQAQAYHAESLAIGREMGDRWGEADSLHCLGLVALERGDPAGARTRFGAALPIYQEIGDRPGVADALEGFAAALADGGDAAAAQRFAGAAAALRESLSPAAPAGRQAVLARRVERAGEALDAPARAAARAGGWTEPLEQVLAAARALAAGLPSPAP